MNLLVNGNSNSFGNLYFTQNAGDLVRKVCSEKTLNNDMQKLKELGERADICFSSSKIEGQDKAKASLRCDIFKKGMQGVGTAWLGGSSVSIEGTKNRKSLNFEAVLKDAEKVKVNILELVKSALKSCGK
ncbi:hypothetical protein KBA27_06035 [bacterium]|nr:hypothetical protein [bacterium]